METAPNRNSSRQPQEYYPGFMGRYAKSRVMDDQESYCKHLTDSFVFPSGAGCNHTSLSRSNGPEFVTVADAQIAVANADPFASFVPASNLTFQDTYHFDADGQQILGERFAAAYLPEPATMSLLAIGGLALIRRRRRA